MLTWKMKMKNFRYLVDKEFLCVYFFIFQIVIEHFLYEDASYLSFLIIGYPTTSGGPFKAKRSKASYELAQHMNWYHAGGSRTSNQRLHEDPGGDMTATRTNPSWQCMFRVDNTCLDLRLFWSLIPVSILFLLRNFNIKKVIFFWVMKRFFF